MAKGIKIANPGINALTNTNPKNFSIYVDGTTNHILIKEKARGSITVSATSTDTVAHNLAYVPMVFALSYSFGDYYWCYGLNPYADFNVWITDSDVVFDNDDSLSKNFYYYIFYDEL